jgi:hypothetical protein
MNPRREGDRDPLGRLSTRRSADNRLDSPDDRRQGHVAEADIRLDALEAGLARVALGLEPFDTIPTYIRLLQVARWHLKAA